MKISPAKSLGGETPLRTFSGPAASFRIVSGKSASCFHRATFKPFHAPLFSPTDCNTPGLIMITKFSDNLFLILPIFQFLLQVMVVARTKSLLLLCSVLVVVTIVIFHKWSNLLNTKPNVKGLLETSTPEVTGLPNAPMQTAKGRLNTLKSKVKGPSTMTTISNSSLTPKVTSVLNTLKPNSE